MAANAQKRMSHITIERNRRKQMSENIGVLRSLMPTFYVKKGDQASIIGGVVDYINELREILQSLEAKKLRKAYAEMAGHRPVISMEIEDKLMLNKKPPLSNNAPFLVLNTSFLHSNERYSSQSRLVEPSSVLFSTEVNIDKLVANSTPSKAIVEVNYLGPNVLLKTLLPPTPGQFAKLVDTIERQSLEILHATVCSEDNLVLYSFTLKVGIKCQLSAEELEHHIQNTFL